MLKKTAEMEDSASIRAELNGILDALKGVVPQNHPPGNPDLLQSKVIELQAEVSHLRNVIGDYHPGPDSSTYKALLLENGKLKKENNMFREREIEWKKEI